MRAAQRLRIDATSAERSLWAGLRRRGVEGFRFRRQVELLGFIVDFACFEARVVIEVDGATHASDDEIARDVRRDAVLRAHGNTVLRFGNVEVFENLDGVLETIRSKLLELKPEGAAASVSTESERREPPPRPSRMKGEGA